MHGRSARGRGSTKQQVGLVLAARVPLRQGRRSPEGNPLKSATRTATAEVFGALRPPRGPLLDQRGRCLAAGRLGGLIVSTLTKVFVVLLVLFSIAFTSMTVSIVAQTTNWKDTALKYQEHARIADTNLRHEIAAGAALLATARDDVRAHLSKIGQLETDRQAARTEAGRLRSELAKADSEKSSSEAMNRGLLSQLDVAEAARSEYRSQRDTLETRSIDIERRNVDLNDRVNELTARVDVLFEQRRHFEQQINILRSENDALARQTRGFTTGEFEHLAK